MYLIVEENPNCPYDERVFSSLGKPRLVKKLHLETPQGQRDWCDVTGVDNSGRFTAAQAVQVEDSGAGNAWLIYGGDWGIRFKPEKSSDPWALANSSQWGAPFKVLDISGEDIQFDN